MKAVILAAGAGRRLANMGWDGPKCLLPCGDRTLLDNLIESLLTYRTRRVVIVVGYQRDRVEAAVRHCPIDVEFVVNEDYAHTNTIHSLWLARSHLHDGFLYFNADVWFDGRILDLLLRHDGSALAVDTKKCADEEVKVIVDAASRITRIGKALPPDRCAGEFIGIGKFDRSACPAMIESLDRYNEELERRNLFFESALDDILTAHVFTCVPIGDLRAIEIDTPEDYAAAVKQTASPR